MPFACTSGRNEAISRSAVSSSNTTTWSTSRSDIKISARSAAGISGRPSPLSRATARVGVDPDEEDVSQPAGGAQIANVTDVEEVEAAVRQHDPLSLGPEPIGQLDGLVKSHAARSPA